MRNRISSQERAMMKINKTLKIKSRMLKIQGTPRTMTTRMRKMRKTTMTMTRMMTMRTMKKTLIRPILSTPTTNACWSS